MIEYFREKNPFFRFTYARERIPARILYQKTALFIYL